MAGLGGKGRAHVRPAGTRGGIALERADTGDVQSSVRPTARAAGRPEQVRDADYRGLCRS